MTAMQGNAPWWRFSDDFRTCKVDFAASSPEPDASAVWMGRMSHSTKRFTLQRCEVMGHPVRAVSPAEGKAPGHPSSSALQVQGLVHRVEMGFFHPAQRRWQSL